MENSRVDKKLQAQWVAHRQRNVPVWTWRLLLFVFLGAAALAFAGAAEGFEYWLARYQTLVAGAFALVGAWWTVRGLQTQIEQMERHEARRRQSDDIAARAVMPLALSSLIDYAAACLKGLGAFHPNQLRLLTSLGIPTFKLPDLPADILIPLRDCARAADLGKAGEIANLISAVQIQRARLKDLGAPPGAKPPETQVVQGIIDSAAIYSRASALFAYARREDGADLPSSEAEQLQLALKISYIDVDSWPFLKAQVCRILSRQNRTAPSTPVLRP